MFPKRTTNLFLVFFLFLLVGVIWGLDVSSVMGQPSIMSGTPRILETGEIRVGVRRDLGPYGYLEENGNCCVGFDVDIANEFAKRWQKTLRLVPLQSGDRIPLLESGSLDLVIAAMTHTKARDETIDFSQSYFQDGLQLLVRKDSGIQEIEDLNGLRVGGVITTTGLTWAAEQAAAYNFTVEPPFSSYDEAIEVLINGGINALISDGGAMLFRAQQYPDLLTVVGQPLTEELYGIGIPQGDSTLRELVNYTLQAMAEDGTYDKIYRERFDDKTPFPIEIVPGEKTSKLEDYKTGIALSEQSRFDTVLRDQKIVIGVPVAKSFQADIAREFVQRWLRDETALDMRIVTTQTGTTALINGEIDLLISNFLPTWQADQTIDFSQTYAADQAYLLVYNNTGIQKLEDLRDKTVAFVANTNYKQWIEVEALRYNIQAKNFANYEAAFSALTSFEVSAIAGDQENLNFWAEQNTELSVLETSYTIPYVIGVPQGDYRLRELVDFTLQTMKYDGFYDCLYEKWFPQGAPYAIEILSSAENYLPLRYENLEENRTCLPKSAIQRIGESGNVVVGVLDNFPPMGFINENNEWVGFDLDLIDAMAEIWGVKVERVKVLANQRIPLLMSGEVDLVAAAMTHTRDRDALIDFSQNYFVDGQSILVRKGSNIAGPFDLNDKRVGAIESTTGIIGITTFRDNKGLQFEIVPFTEDPVAVDALVDGNIDAFTTDRIALLQFAEIHPDLTVAGEPFSSEPYGFGLQAGDSQFRHLVDATLQDLANSGRYYEIYSKWFPNSIPHTIEVLPDGQQSYPLTIETLTSTQRIPTQSAFDKMQSEKKLVAGVIDEFAPFGNLDQNRKCCVGFDVDIIKEFAKRWLGNDSESSLELVPLKTNQRIPALVNGEVDLVAAAMTHNWERDILIDFSQTYFLDGQSLLVRKGSEITDLNDLPGKRVGSASGSTSIEQIEEYAKQQGIDIEILPFAEHKLGVEALLADQIDVYTTDRVALLQFAQDNSDLVVVGEPFTHEPYGIGIPENDYQLRDLVNSTLQEMQIDGTYEKLYQKWFGTPPVRKLEIWPKLSNTGYLGFSQAPMIYIPSGEFLRGNSNGDNDEHPEKLIYLDGFYLDQYEVTNRLYRECVAAGGCTPPQKTYSLEERGDYYNNIERYGNYPVIWVTWAQAEQYCKFIKKRLPTEAEWEKAGRGSQNFIFPWGNTLLPEVQSTFSQYKDTVAVGSFALDVSDYQAYDMAGNVREWVKDFYDRTYYTRENIKNPIGPTNKALRVLRGGSWIISQADLWSMTNREGYNPESYTSNIGFRCAASQPPIHLLPTN